MLVVAAFPGVVRRLWGDLPAAQALGKRFESDGLFYTVSAIIPDFDPRGVQSRTSLGE